MLIEKKRGKIRKRNLTKHRSMKTRPLLIAADGKVMENERLYRTLADSSPDNIFIVRRDTSVQYMNRSGLEHFGLTLEAIAGKKASDLFPPEMANSLTAPVSTVFQTGKPIHAENEASFLGVVSWRDEHWIPLKTGSETTAVLGISRDITERKRAEELLKESEEKYRALVENSPNLTGILQDGVLKYVNTAAILKLGWTYEELVSPSFDPIEKVVSQKSRSLLMENVGRRLRGEDHAPYEISLTRKDGSEVPVSVRGAKIVYNQKPAIEFVFDDITERKRAEEKLRQSEERYHSLFERMLDGVYLSTHEGRFVDVNDAFVMMFGYSSKKEMLDITDIKKELYFSPEERGSHILDTDQEEVKEYRMRRKDGSEVWVEDHGGYVHDEQGNIVYHEGILRDITERKRLEEELKQYSLHLKELVAGRTGQLRESEEKYRELFEASPISLWEHDYSAAKQFLDELRQKGVSNFGAYFDNHPKEVTECAALVKVLNVNKATLNLYNAKTKDELIGTGGLSRVLATENAAREFTDALVAMAQGKHYEAEIENITLRDETKQCHLICAVVPGYEESLAKVLVCIVDLTPQKKLEAELVRSQRLAVIGETAAMVGHDLRNPLQGIAGAVYLLKQESLTAEERNEMLQVIEKSVHYADAIVKDLSDYAAEIKLKPVEATPRLITRDAIGAVKVPENVRVQDLSEDQPTLRVDPDMMKRVFINLIENAIDAMPQGGTLTVSSKKSDGNVEIAFTDTGSGISEKTMEDLWKPLRTTKAKGMGLGLSICRRIVDAHGGSISVESKAGEGTIMTIRIPIPILDVVA